MLLTVIAENLAIVYKNSIFIFPLYLRSPLIQLCYTQFREKNILVDPGNPFPARAESLSSACPCSGRPKSPGYDREIDLFPESAGRAGLTGSGDHRWKNPR